MEVCIATDVEVLEPSRQAFFNRFGNKTADDISVDMSIKTTKTTISDRIQGRLDVLGLTAKAASLKAGLSGDAIRNIFRKPDSLPRGVTLLRLAAALECSPEFLLRGAAESNEKDVATIPYGGIAEAGPFRPVDMLDQVSEDKHVPIPYDSRFGGATQWAFEVRGDSMELEHIEDGMWATVISYPDYLDRNGDIPSATNVLVKRTRFEGSEIEFSIKQIKFTHGRVELHPRSKNLNHKVQVYEHGQADDKGTLTEIVGVVSHAGWVFNV